MGLRMKNFDIMGAYWKIWYLGNSMENQYIAEELHKKGDLGSFQS